MTSGASGVNQVLEVGLVAGESSGDTLGAALVEALRERVGPVRCYGVCGPKMKAAGVEQWADSHELAVMGPIEPLKHLPRLWRLRRRIQDAILRARPHVFIGIDAPAFNLGLESRLRAGGLATVQYVSPQVWAWRQGRVRGIARACDLVLCLFPFESGFYARHGVRAAFVGHPLADRFPLRPDRAAARIGLALPDTGTVVALLPGSRLNEVKQLGEDFLRAALWLRERRPGTQFVAPMASAGVRAVFEAQRAEVAPDLALRLLDGGSQAALAASDAVLVASGTASLETLLSKRPMVVAYRFGALTAFLVRSLRLFKLQHFSQPNLLTSRPLVPEFLQEAVTGEALGAALLGQLTDVGRHDELEREFLAVHETLRVGGAGRAADAVLALLRDRGIWAEAPRPERP